MIRLFIYLVLAILILKTIKKIFAPVGKDERKEINKGEDMVKDPNCNTYIPRHEALSCSIGGVKVFFCSKECMKNYKEK